MDIKVAFKDLDRSESLVNYAVETVSSASRFLIKGGSGHVTIKREGVEYSVDIYINSKVKSFVASSRHESPYHAVDLTVTKLEKQFIKTRKLKQKHKSPEWANSRRFETIEVIEKKTRFKKAA